MQQLDLAIEQRLDAQIGDFAGPGWVPIIDVFRQMYAGLLNRLYLHGPAGTGKSHFLAAACETYQQSGRSAIQVSLQELIQAPVDALMALEGFQLVALDDLEIIQSSQPWQKAVFHLLNRSASGETQLIFASRLAPALLELKLPDLRSRLGQAACFAVPDGQAAEDRQAMLQAIIRRRGLLLDDRLVSHLVTHGPIATNALLGLLDQIASELHSRRRKLGTTEIRHLMDTIEQARSQAQP